LRNGEGIRVTLPSEKWEDPYRRYEQSQVWIYDSLIADNETGVVIGVDIVGLFKPLPELEVQDLVYMEGNRILRNRDYGIALAEARCPEVGIGEPPPVLIVGKDNEIRGNGKADLCPEHYPWPPGFVKGP
jgi:hypothetical protein